MRIVDDGDSSGNYWPCEVVAEVVSPEPPAGAVRLDPDTARFYCDSRLTRQQREAPELYETDCPADNRGPMWAGDGGSL